MSDVSVTEVVFFAMNFLLTIGGIIFSVVLKRLLSQNDLAHQRIDQEIVDRHNSEIKLHERLNNHLTKSEVKDFVDRTIKPVSQKLDHVVLVLDRMDRVSKVRRPNNETF